MNFSQFYILFIKSFQIHIFSEPVLNAFISFLTMDSIQGIHTLTRVWQLLYKVSLLLPQRGQ